MPSDERRSVIVDALSKLRDRNKFGAGRITQGDIGRSVGVHQNTVARWERSVMLPDDEATVGKVNALSNHVNDWHLKISQFMIVESDPDHSDIFSSVTYKSGPDPMTVRVSCRISRKMKRFVLMVIGSERGKILLSADGVGFHETLEFVSTRGRGALTQGRNLEFFLRFG